MIQIEKLRGRRGWIAAAGVLVILIGVFFVMEHLLSVDRYRGQIEGALSQSLGREVKLGQVSYSLFTGSLVANTPSIADDSRFSAQPFLTAKRIRVGVETGALLFRHELHIHGLTIEQPTIALLRATDGSWNFSNLGGKSASGSPGAGSNGLLPGLTIGRIRIVGGTVSVSTVPARAPAHVYTDLNLNVKDFAMTKAFPFTANGKLPDGGTVAISGTAGPVNAQDTSLTAASAQISLRHADLLAAGFVEPQQDVSGVADVDAKVVSNGQEADASGKLHVADLRLAKNGTASSEPVDVEFSLEQDLRALSGKIVSAKVAIGDAKMSVSGSYQTTGNVTQLQLRASGDKMPVNALVAFLPSVGVQLPPGSRLRGGVMSATLDVTGPVNAPVISGPVRIAGSQLAGFDLGQRLGSLQALTGVKTGVDTTVQTLDGTVHYGRNGVQTDIVAVVIGGLGSASGNGSISPGGGLDYHLVVKPDTSGIVGVAAHVLGAVPGLIGRALGHATKNGIPVRVSGTTSNPVFTPDVGGILGTKAASNEQPANPLGKALGAIVSH